MINSFGLRDYQIKAITDLMKALVKSIRKSVILEMPTGGGKTRVFSAVTGMANAKKSNVLILTDRIELLTGTADTLVLSGVSPHYVASGRKLPPGDGVTVAMAQTLKNRIGNPKWLEWFASLNLIIIDECHKQEYNKFFQYELFKGKTVIGVSATPKRSGKQRQLGEDYDEIVHTLTTVELIEKGFLMPDLTFLSALSPSMKGVAKDSKGDYSESAMFKRYDTPKVYDGLINDYKTHTHGQTMLVFCANIIHTVRTCIKLNEAGINARFLCSNMAKPKRPEDEEPEDKSKAGAEWVKYWEKQAYYEEYSGAMALYSGERTTLINRWRGGEFEVMVNAGILTTGFDFPGIQVIALLRATISEILFLQMLGRGSRPCNEIAKTHFTLFDYGTNCERLGGYKMPRGWHLWHENKSGSGNPPVKQCGEPGADKYGNLGCGDFIMASAKICPNPECGYVYPEKKEGSEIELQLMAEDASGQFKAVKPISAMSYEELEVFAKFNKFKQMWVVVQIYVRDGSAGLEKYRTFKGYKPGWKTRIISHIPTKVVAEREAAEQK